MRQKNVLRDRHQRNQRQFLVDDDDAERLGIIDVAKAPLLAAEDGAALVIAVWIDAAENLHQGRLAGAVLADQRMDLPRLHREVDVAQGLNAGKTLAYAAHFENCGHRAITSIICLSRCGRTGRWRRRSSSAPPS